MIGGVFLEHFVTVFDFDNARIGFAEPAGGVHELTTLNEVLPASAAEALSDPSVGGRSCYLGLLCSLSVTTLGVFLLGRMRRHRAEELLEGSEDDGTQLTDSTDSSEEDIGRAAAAV